MVREEECGLGRVKEEEKWLTRQEGWSVHPQSSILEKGKGH